jgi:hypothetical protein
MSRVLVGQERNHSGPRFGDGPWTRSYATSPHATLALGHGISTPLNFTFFTIFTSTAPPSYPHRSCCFPRQHSRNYPTMPSSVLGKRTRSSDSGTTDILPIGTAANASFPASKAPLPRTKRQARADIFIDENENPFCSKVSSEDDQDGYPMQVDSLSDLTPIEQGRSGKRFVSSPVKLGRHFHIIKHNNG